MFHKVALQARCPSKTVTINERFQCIKQTWNVKFEISHIKTFYYQEVEEEPEDDHEEEEVNDLELQVKGVSLTPRQDLKVMYMIFIVVSMLSLNDIAKAINISHI